MLVTQEQAREMWCPEARSMHTDDAYTVGLSASYNRLNSPSHKDDLAPKSCRCIASKCMWWRWVAKPTKDQMELGGFIKLLTEGGSIAENERQTAEAVKQVQDAPGVGYCGMAGKP